MLVNGKQIVNLILGGEAFTSERAFPQYYKFGANKELDNVPVYGISVGAKSKSFSPLTYSDEHGSHQQLVDIDCSNLVLVYQQVSCNGEQYVFLKTSVAMVGSSWAFGSAFWVKASDLGGMLPNPEVGGVNSPSYILFIFNMKEAAPHVS